MITKVVPFSLGLILLCVVVHIWRYNQKTESRLSAFETETEMNFINSSSARQMLGDSPRVVGSVKSNLTQNNQDGKAIFNIPVEGKIKHGLLFVSATEKEGVWSVDNVSIQLDGDQKWIPLPNLAPQNSFAGTDYKEHAASHRE